MVSAKHICAVGLPSPRSLRSGTQIIACVRVMLFLSARCPGRAQTGSDHAVNFNILSNVFSPCSPSIASCLIKYVSTVSSPAFLWICLFVKLGSRHCLRWTMWQQTVSFRLLPVECVMSMPPPCSRPPPTHTRRAGGVSSTVWAHKDTSGW